MRFLAVRPEPLMYTKVFLRLEPLGLELVAEAARRSGHKVRLLDLQAEPAKTYFKLLDSWRPQAIGFSWNYLANVPEIIDLAKATRRLVPNSFVFVGGHSTSFTARDLLAHADGALYCVLRGEGEASVPALPAATPGSGDDELLQVPGVFTPAGHGPRPYLSMIWTHCSGRGTCSTIADAISSACWIRARRSSSSAAALGRVLRRTRGHATRA